MTADPARRARVREAIGSAVQYTLLFGFAAVAAAISAHGLVGFARTNMALPGPWPYLLWGALDGAAGLCAVLLVRRAARGESALAPRLAVWGLVAASSWFNWAHAPHHPGARQAFALMPVIAAVLFEFSLRETRHTARGAERRIAGLSWLYPAERIRVYLHMAADASLPAGEATRRVRVESAARRLHVLRLVLAGQDQAAKSRSVTAWRAGWAERRAQAALTRARFANPAIAAEVLRQVQVLTLTPALARLDYSAPAGAHTLLANLITSPPPEAPPAPGRLSMYPCPAAHATPNGHSREPVNGTRPLSPADGKGAVCWAAGHLTPSPSPDPRQSGNGDRELVAAAERIIAQAQRNGEPLSQVILARRLRGEGYHIANERLRWLAGASGLGPATGRS